MPKALKGIIYGAWALLVLANLSMLLGMVILPACIQYPLLLLIFLALLCLLIRHNRSVAQWRFVILTLVLYSLFRVACVWLHASGLFFLRENMGQFALLLAIEATFAGWFALLALIIRRDVSLAYLVIFFLLGAPLLRAAVLDAGSVLNFLTGPESSDPFLSFSAAEPVTMNLWCMATLGFLAFVPHFIWLSIKELRG